MTLKSKILTRTQQNAIHVYFEAVADEFNEKGISQRIVLEQLKWIDVPNTKESIKEVWRAIQVAQTGKKSTASLTGKEIDGTYDTLNKFIGEKFKIHIPFPNRLYLMQDNE